MDSFFKQQARRAGALLACRGFLPDVVHTSVQRRAIVTADPSTPSGQDHERDVGPLPDGHDRCMLTA